MLRICVFIGYNPNHRYNILLRKGIDWWYKHWKIYLTNSGLTTTGATDLKRVQTGNMVGAVLLTPGEIIGACKMYVLCFDVIFFG